MPHLKVVHVVHQFLPHHRHGVELSTYELAVAQRKAGHTATIVAGERGYFYKELHVEEEFFNGIPVVRIYFNPRNENGFLHHTGLEEAFARVLVKERPDVVHFQHLLNLSLSTIHAAKRLEVPTVLSLRDYALICPRVNLVKGDGSLCYSSDLVYDCQQCLRAPKPAKRTAGLGVAAEIIRHNLTDPRSWRLVTATSRAFIAPGKAPVRLETPQDFEVRNQGVMAALNSVDMIVALSGNVASRFERLAHLQKSIKVLHQGPDTSHCRYRIRPLDSRMLRLGFIGKLTRVKGIEVLLSAFRLLPPRTAELHIFGSPTWRSIQEVAYYLEMRRLGDSAGIAFHTDPFSRTRIREVFDQFDVLVVPSIWWEAFGRVVVEALASGVPVICSDQGGPTELIHDGENGCHFKLGDTEDLARVIQRLADDPAEVTRLSRNIQLPKTLEAYVGEVETLYRQTIGDHRREATPTSHSARDRLFKDDRVLLP